MDIGIIGLPNSGKTTLFNALTRGTVETAGYTSGRMEVHTAIVQVPDPRLDRLGDMFRPKKLTHAHITYRDIAGLARGIGEAGGLAGPLLNEIGQNDALLLVVRAFEDPNILHPEESIDPARDIELVETELMLNDMLIITKRLERIDQRVGKGGDPKEVAAMKREREILARLLEHLETERPLREFELAPDEEKLLRGFSLLSQKPLLVVLNIDEDADERMAEAFSTPTRPAIALRGQLEAELAQMEPDEAAEFLAEFGIEEPGFNRVIRASYELMDVISFFTVSEEEVRSWTIRKGATALDAAAAVHSDLARGFIRAEVIAFDELVAAGSLAEARRRGLLRLEGKEYVVQDGEIVHIRFAL
ncbi:MAG: redox-regulated ATPase YchF [Chloroflexi bacterium]|nr:redox-regulated ATPase YchF [Chloroflexota bacterium]